MGDRANIVVKQEPDNPAEIFLYSHWGGEGLVTVLHRVLSRRDRWNDPAYLTRMIFSAMVKDDIDGSTGFGIGIDRPDNSYPYIVVDVPNQEVRREAENGRAVIVRASFDEFVKFPDALKRVS